MDASQGEVPEIPKWICWSTFESINNNIPSATAIVETLIAVPLYWWIAVHFETYTPLIFSAALVPLVLLRSDKSMSLGIEWFMTWENSVYARQDAKKTEKSKFWLTFVLTVAAAGAAYLTFYFLTEHFLTNVESWWQISLVYIVGWISVVVAVAISAAVAGVVALIGSTAITISTAASLTIIVSLIVKGAGSTSTFALALGAVTLPSAILLPSILSNFLSEADSLSRKLKRIQKRSLVADKTKLTELAYALNVVKRFKIGATIPIIGDIVSNKKVAVVFYILLVCLMPLFFEVLIGIFGISIAMRIAATIRNLLFGLRALPQNFRRIIFCTSPLQEPELVPGLKSQNTSFTFQHTLQHLLASWHSKYVLERLFVILIAPLVLFVLFFPAWIYRLTLKSTAWFWWPLAFLGADLRHAKHPEIFRQKVLETLWAKVSIALAIMTILGFVLTTLFFDGIAFERNPFLSVLGFLFLVDWSIRPWQLLAVGSAVLSVVIVFLIDSASREYSYATAKNDNNLRIKLARKFGWIERVARLRFLLVVGFCFLVGAHAILYFNSTKCWFNVPSNVENWARMIYRDRLPHLECYSSNHNTLLLSFTFFRLRAARYGGRAALAPLIQSTLLLFFTASAGT